jgi:hypothetical protein|nr:MAG TPA: Protein of unknown function (DUF1642) [Caudoviricetes sp.]
MERHELINKYEKRLQKENPSRIEQLYCEIIRDLFDLEQTKVEVPEFVAEWIEQCKEKGKSLLKSLLYTPEKVNSWVDNSENQETFALAWMFGYTIKKEPRYFVEIKATKHRFAKYGNGRIYFSLKYESAFTKAELEKDGFGWVFDCTGIEILEVEE